MSALRVFLRMAHSRQGCKRPRGKYKLLAKLADNIFHSTKPYRCGGEGHAAPSHFLLIRIACAQDTHEQTQSQGTPESHTRLCIYWQYTPAGAVRAQWFKFSEVERDKISAWNRWRQMKQAALTKRAHGGELEKEQPPPTS